MDDKQEIFVKAISEIKKETENLVEIDVSSQINIGAVFDEFIKYITNKSNEFNFSFTYQDGVSVKVVYNRPKNTMEDIEKFFQCFENDTQIDQDSQTSFTRKKQVRDIKNIKYASLSNYGFVRYYYTNGTEVQNHSLRFDILFSQIRNVITQIFIYDVIMTTCENYDKKKNQ